MERTTRSCLVAFGLFFLLANAADAQIRFKLHWMPDSLAWGVFAKPDPELFPSKFTVIGSGQVTLVAPAGMEFSSLQSFSGVWEQNAFVGAPSENPEKDYISFGLISNDPPIVLQDGEETLLFTFIKKGSECPESLYLIENDDPFNNMPNSMRSNPGNDLSVMDPGQGAYYLYSGNYDLDAWNCEPGKTVPLGDYRQGKGHSRRLVNRP